MGLVHIIKVTLDLDFGKRYLGHGPGPVRDRILKWWVDLKDQWGMGEGVEQREKSSMEAKITRTARTTSV